MVEERKCNKQIIEIVIPGQSTPKSYNLTAGKIWNSVQKRKRMVDLILGQKMVELLQK